MTTCTKRAYHRRRDAKRALKRIQSHGCGVRREYRCPVCGAWHLTSRREWRQ